MKIRPAIVVLIICVLGIAASATAYLLAQNRAGSVFAGELDVAALQRLAEREESFLVYFYGRSCEDCAASEPYLLEALAAAPQVKAYKCEREANATVRSLYGVDGTPTLIYFYQGQESARLEGPRLSVEDYHEFLATL